MSIATTMPLPSQFVTKVVGVSFSDNYPNNIYGLAQSIAVTGAPCILIREPENVHDNNAIRVDANNTTIGHLPKLIALILAPQIDAGEIWLASARSIVVSKDNMNKPGLKITVWRQENATL